MNDWSTRPERVASHHALTESLWQGFDESWSFGPSQVRLVGDAASRTEQRPPDAKNEESAPLTQAPQEIRAPERQSRKLRPRGFGRRGFTSVSHWEGVVERVDGEAFYARLVPFEQGQPLTNRAEFAEFDFDELATKSDQKLVCEGAVFYWTLGRSQNAAGTVTNTSLLRFRRLPGVSEHTRQRAKAEVKNLMSSLGVQE